jgi:hypothetical protein
MYDPAGRLPAKLAPFYPTRSPAWFTDQAGLFTSSQGRVSPHPWRDRTLINTENFVQRLLLRFWILEAASMEAGGLTGFTLFPI